eukprot:5232342-Pyramimonas_sp.AAC.2
MAAAWLGFMPAVTPMSTSTYAICCLLSAPLWLTSYCRKMSRQILSRSLLMTKCFGTGPLSRGGSFATGRPTWIGDQWHVGRGHIPGSGTNGV